MKGSLKPTEILAVAVRVGEEKGRKSISQLIVLGILAGAFIAFAAEGSNMAAFNLLAQPHTYGLGKVLAGAVFGTGLMLVVICGGELFTGNTLMLTSWCERKIKFNKVAQNWAIVYIGNFIGSILIAYMVVNSGLLNSGDHMLGAVTLKTAIYKVNLTFSQGLFLGIMCNWLVCLAVWIAYGAESIGGKILGIFFPIWLFVTSGFEHSVANMYYVPAGILIRGSRIFAETAGVSGEQLSGLTWTNFFLGNLIPVTIGNIIGGGIFVGMAYWFAYRGNKTK